MSRTLLSAWLKELAERGIVVKKKVSNSAHAE
ncbi:MAG: DNA-binding HxlR family transcriptional regulator [Cryomorphaceae bacterium]|jgi:DNA-binding HxlR family transcriptional regulator